MARVIIGGGGKIGTKLAEILIKEKHDIVLVEKDQNRAEELGEKLDALILHGDASERKILKDGGIEHCDAVVAVTGDDKTNLMVCEIAKSFKVPIIISRVNDSESESIFIKLGITAAINTTTSAILNFKKALESPGQRMVNMVAGEKAEVFEMVVPKGAKVIDRTVGDVAKKFVIAAIYRNGDLIDVRPGSTIQEGDVLVICTPVVEVKNVQKLF